MSEDTVWATTRSAWGVLQSTPLWILSGTTCVLAAATIWPDFGEPVASHLPALLLGSAIATTCKLGDVVARSAGERRRAYRKRDQKRFAKIYRPLACLFITRHVEICVGVGAPTLAQRMACARSELFHYRSKWVGLRQAARALIDRRTTTSAEMALGTEFSMKAIIARVQANSEHADARLLQLMRRADLSLYEGRGDGILTDEQIALIKHISDTHDALAAKFP